MDWFDLIVDNNDDNTCEKGDGDRGEGVNGGKKRRVWGYDHNMVYSG